MSCNHSRLRETKTAGYWRLITSSGLLVLNLFWGIAAGQPAVANPATNAGPLQNPLKGFHIGFDETCCLEAPQEVYFGNFMATVGYQNFNWADLEPVDDQFDWTRVDNELSARAGSRNKHVIVQLNAEWTQGDTAGRTPDWFINDPRFEKNEDELGFANGGYQSHKYESEFYQEEVKEFIAEFIHRFKDDPRIFIIQMGMVGYFGEFNVFPNDDLWLPEDIKTMFFEHYRDHLFGEIERDSSGKLVVVESGAGGSNSENYSGYSALTQARYPAELGYNVPTDGIGYTNGWINIDGIPGDGNNDDDIGNSDFNDAIDQIATGDGRKLWNLGPIGGEWPPNRQPGNEGVQEEWTSFWGTLAGEDYLKRGHYSFARPPQVDTISTLLGSENWRLVPEGWNFFAGDAKQVGDNYEGENAGGDLFRNWHRMMGYNYQLSNIQHYFSAGQTRINISFDVENVGLAPFYFDWNVELAILDSGNNMVQLIPVDNTDMRTWRTNEISSVEAGANLAFDVSLPASEYRIGLRLSQPGATEPKTEIWELDARNTYIVISNDVDVIDGEWRSDLMNTLQGGWNILDDVVIDSRCPVCEARNEMCMPIVTLGGRAVVVCL